MKCGSREHCSLDARGVAVCGCGPECEPAVRPVCGSDGRTYDTRCHLDRASCLDNRDVRVAYTGPCGKLNVVRRKIGSAKVCSGVVGLSLKLNMYILSYVT